MEREHEDGFLCLVGVKKKQKKRDIYEFIQPIFIQLIMKEEGEIKMFTSTFPLKQYNCIKSQTTRV